MLITNLHYHRASRLQGVGVKVCKGLPLLGFSGFEALGLRAEVSL